uniref:C2H2-type domain-containing protein n=1 Tax=Leptobrachium leishanense TaxID=445787 RepID=A0A8C5MNJ9_9ANUR
MKKKKDKLVAGRLLDLTLEILSLLTGEDYVVGKSGNLITRSTGHRRSGTQSHSMKPQPHSVIHEEHSKQKILELSNQIIRLLTGEVPIRCEDVTVHLSMEEWEYVERHKELYEDIIMEDLQPLGTLNSTKANSLSFEAQVSSSFPTRQEKRPHEVRVRAEPPMDAQQGIRNIPEAPRLWGEGHLPDVCGTTEQVQVELRTSAHIKEEPEPWEEAGFTSSDIYLTTERGQREYPSSDIKREPASSDVELTDTGMFPPIGHTPREYLSAQPEEEPTLFDSDLYPPIEARQLEYICHVMEGLPSHEDRPLVEPTEYPLFAFAEYGNVPMETQQVVKYQGWSQEPKTYSCSNMGKYIYHKTPFQSGVDVQRRLHHEKTLHSCPECGKCFNQKSVLVRHLRIHTGEKPYSCCECGKSFRQKAVLVRHQKIHTSGKPYSCSECWKFFSYESDLLRHQDVHNLRKDHACSECGKFFRHQSDLKRHQRMHTGEKPFSCFKCGKCFTQKSNLVKHLSVHVQQTPQPSQDHARRPTQKLDHKKDFSRHTFTSNDVRIY